MTIFAWAFAILWLATLWVLWVISGAAVREKRRAEEYKEQGGKMLEHYFVQVDKYIELAKAFNALSAEREGNRHD